MLLKINRQAIFFLFAIVSLVQFSSCKLREKVGLVVHHAKIYTVNDSFEVKEAMAIQDGKIVATGTNDEILKKYESAEEINAGGKAIFPGFIDAHCHFSGYAMDGWKCDVVGTSSWEDIIEKITAYSKDAPMEWIYGRGWDQNDWAVKNYPDNSKLDSLFPDRPVYLKRIDGHAAIANSKALALAGITATTKINGGEIVLKNGKPSGVLVDNAMSLVEVKIPQIDEKLAIKYFGDMQMQCFALGLTGVQDCGISEQTISWLQKADEDGKLKMKIFALLSDNTDYYPKWVKQGRQTTGRITVGGFKFYADGALGSRGACMLQPYSDKPGWHGFLLSDTAHFTYAAQQLAGSNLQMCVHAIGDSGNRQILKTMANVLQPGNDRRWRIEHAQIVNPNDFHYFADYNIIPSVQPTHATSDMYWAQDRIGAERMKGAYAYKTLLQTNNWMPLGTDFPVEDISPFKTFYAAVVREDAKGFPEGGFQINEALTRQEAIRGMTIWAAKAAFEEKEKGSLVAGKAADFIMLDTDLMEAAKDKLLQTKVVSTYINGEKVYSSKK